MPSRSLCRTTWGPVVLTQRWPEETEPQWVYHIPASCWAPGASGSRIRGDIGFLPEANAHPGGTVGQPMLPAGDGAVAAVRRGQQEQGLCQQGVYSPRHKETKKHVTLPCFTRDDPDECRSTE